MAYDSASLPPHFKAVVTHNSHSCMHTKTSSCTVLSVLVKPGRHNKLTVVYDKMCWGPLRRLRVEFDRACVHRVWVCTPLASFPPGHHMQSCEPRLAPSVGLMPSLSPPAAGPYKLHYSSRVHAGIYYHTHTQWVSIFSEGDFDEYKVYDTMTKILKVEFFFDT